MTLQTRRVGNVTIVDLGGSLKMGEPADSFRDRVQQLIDSGNQQLAINLGEVPEMDSTGIGALVRAFNVAKRSGGKCLFFAPSKRVAMLLKMVRLDTVLEITEDEPTALARF
jgi:anti-anti-sigma factor